MTIMISDEMLEKMADEFVALKLNHHGFTLEQFINAPQICRDLASLKKEKAQAKTGRVDERMKHNRHPRSRSKADFTRRVQS